MGGSRAAPAWACCWWCWVAAGETRGVGLSRSRAVLRQWAGKIFGFPALGSGKALVATGVIATKPRPLPGEGLGCFPGQVADVCMRTVCLSSRSWTKNSHRVLCRRSWQLPLVSPGVVGSAPCPVLVASGQGLHSEWRWKHRSQSRCVVSRTGLSSEEPPPGWRSSMLWS